MIIPIDHSNLQIFECSLSLVQDSFSKTDIPSIKKIYLQFFLTAMTVHTLFCSKFFKNLSRLKL